MYLLLLLHTVIEYFSIVFSLETTFFLLKLVTPFPVVTMNFTSEKLIGRKERFNCEGKLLSTLPICLFCDKQVQTHQCVLPSIA